jgi:uncharacterized protein (TIGR00369 family)
MEPKPPPSFADLPDLFSSESGSSLDARAKAGQGHTLPSVHPSAGHPSAVHPSAGHPSAGEPPDPYRGSAPPVALGPPQPAAPPGGPFAQGFRPSAAMLALGGEILEWSPPQLIRVRYPVRDACANAYGSLSGGFVVAMFEPVVAAMAHAVAPSRQHAILELSARFFRQLRDGFVTVDAALVRAGTTTGSIDCVAWDPRGELCAKASATILFVG